MLGLLFFPDPAMLPKFRKMDGFTLFQNSDNRIIYKYKDFWDSFQIEGHPLKDFTVTRADGDTKEDPAESKKIENDKYYTGIKKLNILLSGNTVGGDFGIRIPGPGIEPEDIGEEEGILTSTINSRFMDESSEEEQSIGSVYTMFEYNVKDNQVTIRSFKAQLIVSDNTEIIEYKKTNGEPVVIQSGSLDSIEQLIEGIKSEENGVLEKLKFDKDLEQKMQKAAEDNDDSYYLLGFTGNKDYTDSILEKLKPSVPQGGGYKQTGGLASEDVESWGNGLIEQIQGIRGQKEEEKKKEKNPPSKTMSDIPQLKEVVEQKSGNVTQQIRGILDKEHAYISDTREASKGGYTRRRKRRRAIKNITLKR